MVSSILLKGSSFRMRAKNGTKLKRGDGSERNTSTRSDGTKRAHEEVELSNSINVFKKGLNDHRSVNQEENGVGIPSELPSTVK